ncbi:MAG: hypothetical protein K2Q25_07495 [Mycobacteriaceae bacterium]|nr:hypothetical protein [Mycobacteriaceae bacterium]
MAALDFFAADEPDTHDYGHESDALDFSAYDTSPSQDTGVDALHAFNTEQPQDTNADFDALHAQGSTDTENSDEPDISSQLFSVTNPPGTVTVTALMDGRILHVELSPQVTTMSESDLADEILVIADLARQKGLAGQHSFLFDTMSGLGASDNAAIRDLLENNLALSSPEQAAEAQAEVFATRYNIDHE